MSIWSGEAPVPVVFLHGFATSTQMTWVEPGWFDLVKEGGRRPLGYDLLGHGGRGSTEGEYTENQEVDTQSHAD